MYKTVPGIPMPLLDSQENGKDDSTYLSTTVQAGNWRSPNKPKGTPPLPPFKYMRVSKSTVLFLDQLLYIYKDVAKKASALVVSGGYRTYTRALQLRSANSIASPKSHHINGVAADYELLDTTGNPIAKSKILPFVWWCMVGNYAEVLSECKQPAMADHEHTAYPVERAHNDANTCPTDWPKLTKGACDIQ